MTNVRDGQVVHVDLVDEDIVIRGVSAGVSVGASAAHDVDFERSEPRTLEVLDEDDIDPVDGVDIDPRTRADA